MFVMPAFGETEFFYERENNETSVWLFPKAASEQFERYCALLCNEGFCEKEAYQTDNRRYIAFEKDGAGVFMNAFLTTGELQLVIEENTSYFDYTDTPGEDVVTSQVTQVKLTDYGLSYVVRLSDGRFLVIDGGNRVDAEADALYDCLKAQSFAEKPVIAGWVMTHPHSDHFYCYFPFAERHGGDVIIEKFFFNFPDAEDYSHYPALETACSRFEGCSHGQVVQMFLDAIKESGFPVYTPHTGQCYKLGNTTLKFLATMDDSIHCSRNINAASLMFTTEIAGQVILWTADGSFSDTRLPERYGAELKADILQIPHHGFGCGTDEAQIQGYRQIAPRVCFLPASHSEAYSTFTIYREGTNFLMTRQNVEEMITGRVQRTLTLPYEPDPSGAIEMRQQYLEGRDDCGSRTWVFTDLNTGNMDDFVFSVLNTTYINANITVELFFENIQRKKVRVRIVGPRLGIFRVNCLLTSDEVWDPENPDFLESKGVPANMPFAVRFISNIPVVISHRNHTPAYHSSIL